MSKLFISTSSGAGVYIFSDDHCPPHVHARHRGEGWIARIKFSFVTNVVQLISIAPLQNIPLQRVVSRLLDDIHARLDVCRRHWWNISRTTCLENQWIGPIARWIVAGSAIAGGRRSAGCRLRLRP